ncbi:MAG: HlyD family secretion protein [Bacteroidota bacterium]
MPNNFEIRSREVQDVLGRPPAWIIRAGISLVLVILALFVLLSFILKFPELVYADFEITQYTTAQQAAVDGNSSPFVLGNIYINQEDIRKIAPKQEVRILVDGFPKSEYGYLVGEILEVADSLNAGQQLRASVSITFEEEESPNIPLKVGMHGDAMIVYKSSTSVFQRISNKD